MIELIIVITIMGIMMTIAAPSMIQWRQNAQIKEVARDILSSLRQARSLAVTENKDVTATINLDTHQLTYDGRTKTFPTTINLEADNDTSLVNTASKSTTFKPQGSCNNELYIRVNNDSNLLISIESTATGLAKL